MRKFSSSCYTNYSRFFSFSIIANMQPLNPEPITIAFFIIYILFFYKVFYRSKFEHIYIYFNLMRVNTFFYFFTDLDQKLNIINKLAVFYLESKYLPLKFLFIAIFANFSNFVVLNP